MNLKPGFSSIAFVCAPGLYGCCSDCERHVSGTDYTCAMLPDGHPAKVNFPAQTIGFVVQTFYAESNSELTTVEVLNTRMVCFECAKRYPEQNGMWEWPEGDERAAFLREQLCAGAKS